MRQDRTSAEERLRIASPDFPAGGAIPDRFSAWYAGDAPRLRISGVPAGAVELALDCHDPDAPCPGGFTHWTLYGIPPDTRLIAAPSFAGGRSGPNDAGGRGWTGPRPPAGHGPHRYVFTLHALAREVEGEPDRATFLAGSAQDVIARARIFGTYEHRPG